MQQVHVWAWACTALEGAIQAGRREFVQPCAQGMPLGNGFCLQENHDSVTTLWGGSHTEFHLSILNSVTPEMTCQGKRKKEGINLSQWMLVPWLCARRVYHCTVLPVIARGSCLRNKGQRDCSQGSGHLQSCQSPIWLKCSTGPWHTQLGSAVPWLLQLITVCRQRITATEETGLLTVSYTPACAAPWQGAAGRQGGTAQTQTLKHLLQVQLVQKQLLGLWQFGEVLFQVLEQ